MVGDVFGAQATLLAILVIAFALLITEALRTDVVGVLLVLALWATGLLDPSEALSGFSSEPAIVVAAMFVLTAALHETGVSDVVERWIGRLCGGGLTRTVGVLVPSVAALSAFTHHVATTAAMLPVTLEIAHRRGLAPSQLLMPLSFAASLGTTITIIGAPAFLIASEALGEAGQPRLHVFSITPIGLAITALGTLFMIGPARWLLPKRQGNADSAARFRLGSYLTEVNVLEGSPLVGMSARALADDPRYRMKVVGRVHEGRRLGPDFEANTLVAGDVLLVQASSDELVTVTEEPGIELHPVAQYAPGSDGSSPPPENGDAEGIEDRLVQAVIAPGSDLVGSTIAAADLRVRFDVVVVGVWRKDAELRDEISRVRLRAGDVLVLQGDEAAIERLGDERAFLMLVPFQGERRVRRKAPLAAAIMVGAVVAAAFGVPLEMATLAGAAAMVLTRCVTAGQAYRAIDQRIFVFIAGAIPLGLAMEKTGTSEAIAARFEGSMEGLPLPLVLLALFIAVGVITQFMSDSATTAVFAPVGIALAEGLGHSPTAYVVTIAMAAVTSFITPLGHHGNLIVYGPGGYRFSDFVRVGTPLTLVVAAAVVLIAPMLWPV